MKDAQRFLTTLAACMPEDERLILCGFEGDPGDQSPQSWKPRPWRHGVDIPFGPLDNGYVTVSSFLRAGDGSYRRRTDCFGSGLAFMIDDVGTKVKQSIVEVCPANAIVETSQGNFQWWYFLDKPVYDFGKFDALIRGFIENRLADNDPGMSGVTRVGRLPDFVNGKEQHKGWRCRLVELNDRRTTFSDLLNKFKLTLQGRRENRVRLTGQETDERIKAFTPVYAFLRQRQMLKRNEFDRSGWMEMTCPWKDHHTGGVNNGAAIREPNPENGFHGAFRCHHGHCLDKGWAELTDWVAETAQEETDDNDARIAAALFAKMKADRDPLATQSIREHFNQRFLEVSGE